MFCYWNSVLAGLRAHFECCSLTKPTACSVKEETIEINAGNRDHVKDFAFTRELLIIKWNYAGGLFLLCFHQISLTLFGTTLAFIARDC